MKFIKIKDEYYNMDKLEHMSIQAIEKERDGFFGRKKEIQYDVSITLNIGGTKDVIKLATTTTKPEAQKIIDEIQTGIGVEKILEPVKYVETTSEKTKKN
jgi:hypothetical protein